MLINLRSENPHLAGQIREIRRTIGNKSDLVRESRADRIHLEVARPDAKGRKRGGALQESGKRSEVSRGEISTSPVRLYGFGDHKYRQIPVPRTGLHPSIVHFGPPLHIPDGQSKILRGPSGLGLLSQLSSGKAHLAQIQSNSPRIYQK